MTTINKQPDLSTLYNKIGTDLQNGDTAAAEKATKHASHIFARENPGATKADFEQSLTAAESGKASSSAISNVVNHVLPGNEEPTAHHKSHKSHSHGGGGSADAAAESSTSTSTTFDVASNSYITQ